MTTRHHRLDSAHQTQVWTTPDGCMPELLYWGDPLPADTDLGALARALTPPLPHGGLDVPERVAWWPEPGRGFTDAPGLALRRGERHLYTALELQAATPEADGWCFDLHEPRAGLAVRLRLTLHAASGVISADSCLTNTGVDDLAVDHLASVVLAVPRRLRERLAFTGRWAAEFQAAREPIGRGSWVQESRVGRSSHHAHPALVLMEAGTDATRGEAWSVQLAWSGNHRLQLQPLRHGGLQLQAGELLLPGELVLRPGATATMATVHLCRSGQGLADLGRRWQRFVRDRVLPPRRGPRPVQFNTWEATYFDHDADRLMALARRAAELGVERFVLDDGWFAGRRHDRAGLGDWTPCPQRYPHGLAPLAEHCRALRMSFGLWVEPEGVSRDSALFRAHPEWVLGLPGGGPPLDQPLGRHQFVLDLGRPEVQEHLHATLAALLRSAPIDCLKWDMNRDMTHAAGADGRAGARRHVQGLYTLIDRLRAEFPALEIETCASGGARADLGILRRTTRVWVSDCNDPLERLPMQRTLLTLLPAETMGVHVGDARSHTTGRTSAMPMRTLAMLLGHAGVEADLLRLGDDEALPLRHAIAWYRENRRWLADATVVALDHDDPAVVAMLALADDGSRGVVTLAAVARLADAVPPPLRMPGLDPDTSYRITVHPAWPVESRNGKTPAGLFSGGGDRVGDAADRGDRRGDRRGDEPLLLAGAALAQAGLALPILLPGTGLLLQLDRVARPTAAQPPTRSGSGTS